MKLQAKYGNATIDRRDIRQDHRKGFSVLRANRETGARTCEIYLPNAQRPKEVDDEATLILGHELLHAGSRLRHLLLQLRLPLFELLAAVTLQGFRALPRHCDFCPPEVRTRR